MIFISSNTSYHSYLGDVVDPALGSSTDTAKDRGEVVSFVPAVLPCSDGITKS
jgi:hypothetical protein